MIQVVKVRQASNGGIAVCIPTEIRREIGLERGQQVLVKTDGKVITIEPIK